MPVEFIPLRRPVEFTEKAKERIFSEGKFMHLVKNRGKKSSEMSSPQRGRHSERFHFTPCRSRSLSRVTAKDQKQEADLYKVLTGSSDEGKKDSVGMQTMPKRNQKKVLKIFEKKMTELEINIKKNRSDIMRVNMMIKNENELQNNLKEQLKHLKGFVDSIVKNNKEKYADVIALFEKVRDSKLEKIAVLEKSASEIEGMRSELVKTERNLCRYIRFEDILFKLSPVDWQEKQKTGASEVQAPSEGDVETTESSPGHMTPPATASTGASSALESESTPDSDGSEHKHKSVLYFTEPEELLDVMSGVTDQILSLIRNCRRVDELHMEQAKAIDIKRKSIEESEKQATVQLSKMKDRLNQVKEGTVRLKQKVQLHDTLKSKDKDIMLHALDKKVSEVYQSCVNKRWSTLGTLEKLTRIENRMSSLVEQVESMPKEVVDKLMQFKEQERRARMQEEKLQREKQKYEQRMKKCKQRALSDSTKIRARKLMPRSHISVTKQEVAEEENMSDEEGLPDNLSSDNEDV